MASAVHSGKTLRKRKEKEQVDGAVVIDVDECNSDNVVLIDAPECSRHGQKGCRAAKKSPVWPSGGVISIDDEEVDNNGYYWNSEGGGDLDSDCTSSNKVHAAANKRHLSSEDADDMDCEMYEEAMSIYFKLSSCTSKGKEHASQNCFGLYSEDGSKVQASQNYFGLYSEGKSKAQACKRRFGFLSEDESKAQACKNRFGFYSEDESSSSDSDNSDCELVEDCSGHIREEWEKAALKKNCRNRRSGLEDRVSASGSTSDPRNMSQGITQENIDKENSVGCAYYSSFREFVNTPNDSNSSDGRVGKDNLYTCPSTPRPVGESVVADSDQSANASSHEAAVFQGEDVHISMEPDICRTQLHDNVEFDNLGSFTNEEIPSGDYSFYKTPFRDATILHHGRASSLNREDPCTTGASDRVEMNTGNKRSFQETEKNVSVGPPCCHTQSQHDNDIPDHDTASSFGKVESFADEDSLGSNNAQKETQASKDSAGFVGKEKTVNMVPPLFKTQTHDALANHGIPSFYEMDRKLSQYPHLEPLAGTRINSGTKCLYCEGKSVPCEHSLSCSGRLESDVNGISVMSDGIVMNGDSVALNSLIGEREKHKETDEYKRALEEEMEARRRELQIQAEEAQRLRKRKKAETMRLLDMERRQRQRLEEVRESQKKDEEIIHLKEKFRTEIKQKLDNLERRHHDMASLLRELGIPVGGGLNPTQREVNVAYKQALLKFHPDRASSSDIRLQVEAEEIFKLISRVKEKLMQ